MKSNGKWELDTVSLGKFLRRSREAVGLYQKEVAIDLGVEVDSVCRYEKGIIRPSAKNLIRMCMLYDIDLNDLRKFVYRSRKKPTPK